MQATLSATLAYIKPAADSKDEQHVYVYVYINNYILFLFCNLCNMEELHIFILLCNLV